MAFSTVLYLVLQSFYIAAQHISTRKGWQEEQSCSYLQERAKKLHVHTPAIDVALEDSSHGEPVDLYEGIFKWCRSVLRMYVSELNELTHHGSALN